MFCFSGAKIEQLMAVGRNLSLPTMILIDFQDFFPKIGIITSLFQIIYVCQILKKGSEKAVRGDFCLKQANMDLSTS